MSHEIQFGGQRSRPGVDQVQIALQTKPKVFGFVYIAMFHLVYTLSALGLHLLCPAIGLHLACVHKTVTCQAHFMNTIRKNARVLSRIVTCLYAFHKLVFECFRGRLMTWSCPVQSMNWRQHACDMSDTFCEMDSQHAPSDSSHKHNDFNVRFAWRPRWTTAEQAHKGAHTYTSAHNALHTCTTGAFAHCSAHIEHICMCDSMHTFVHEHACPLGIKKHLQIVNCVHQLCMKCQVHIANWNHKKRESLKCIFWMGCARQLKTNWWISGDQAGSRPRLGPPPASSPLGLHVVHTWSAHWIPTTVDHHHRHHHNHVERHHHRHHH